MKRCFKCERTLPISEFYRHPMMADGRLGKCKACARADVSANRAARYDYYRAYDRSRANRPERVSARRTYAKTARGREVHRMASARYQRTATGRTRAREWRLRNPLKYRAHMAVSGAIRAGRLVPKPCEVCGAKAQAHHDNYSKPLDVRWLCSAHHTELHQKARKGVSQCG